MINTSAEYDYFKEFIDFNVGFDDRMILHYNGKLEEDLWIYYKFLAEISLKLKLEIETNLITLSDSKNKRRIYLEKLLKKLLDLSEKLDWFESEATEIIVPSYDQPKGFLEILWTRHWNLLEELISYCRISRENIDLIELSSRGRKGSEQTKIIWSDEPHKLRLLYSALITESINKKPFIKNTNFREFESHFVIEVDSSGNFINWVKEKYILTYLFDKLCKHNLIHKSFAANCDVLLSKNFVINGKFTTTTQLSSARSSFLNQKDRLTSKSSKKQQSLLLIDDMIRRFTYKPSNENDLYGSHLDANSARNRF
jgi:hypothetical protein